MCMPEFVPALVFLRANVEETDARFPQIMCGTRIRDTHQRVFEQIFGIRPYVSPDIEHNVEFPGDSWSATVSRWRDD